MYSREFLKFLYSYQKDDFKPKEAESKEIHFSKKGGGKLAEVHIEIKA